MDRPLISPAWRARACFFTLACFFAAATAATAADPTTAPSTPGARPNIFVAIADDWSFPHAGVYGDTCVKTPTFDRIAGEGVLFTRAFCAAPTCSASRASILTGQAPHRLEEGANLWGSLPAKFGVYPDALESAGYVVGFMGKGWGPGSLGDRKRNPAGPAFKSFDAFLEAVPPGKPFCFWFGSHDPHRPYRPGQGVEAGLKLADVAVPPFLPDTPEVRGDLLDYYFAVQRFDRDAGQMLKRLEETGRLANTLVVMTSDNGMPFPRAKANLYDAGAHVPLAVRWPARATGGRKAEGLISLTDLAPTFLEAAGLPAPAEMTGRSFLGRIKGETVASSVPGGPTAGGPATRPAPGDGLFVERERHANVRRGDAGYPARALRTDRFLYVYNLRPDLPPAGDPEVWKAVGPFGDIDGGPSKEQLLSRREDKDFNSFFQLACAKRPAEELYDLEKDPAQLVNVAAYPDYQAARAELRARLDGWMKQTADPRAEAGGTYDRFDRYPYYGAGPDKEPKAPAATNPGK